MMIILTEIGMEKLLWDGNGIWGQDGDGKNPREWRGHRKKGGGVGLVAIFLTVSI